MSKIARFILELARIILILGLICGVFTKILTITLDRFNIDQTESLLLTFQEIIIIVYAIWYYRHGQHQGWFRTNNKV